MNNYTRLFFCLLFSMWCCAGCAKKSKEQQDKIYSRHLQQNVELTIITTPLPENKNTINLLLINDGKDIAELRVKACIDSLYDKKLIEPLVVVAISVSNRMDYYGVAGKPDYNNKGSKAEKYSSFIDNELYAFIKKKTGVRKFKTVSISGCSLGGLSAFDIAWDHADKIDKVGVFSGSFWWRDKDAADSNYSDDANRIMLAKLRKSRKKPALKYWIYAGAQEEKGDRDKDGIIDVVDDTRDLVSIIKNKNIAPSSDIQYQESPNGKHDYESWSKVFPSFLLWAVGKQ